MLFLIALIILTNDRGHEHCVHFQNLDLEFLCCFFLSNKISLPEVFSYYFHTSNCIHRNFCPPDFLS